MHRFDKLDPEHLYTMMLFIVGAWVLGRGVVLPFLSPSLRTATAIVGVCMAGAMLWMGETLRGSR